MENLLILLLLALATLASWGILWFVLDQRYERKLAEQRRENAKALEQEYARRWQQRQAELTEQAEQLQERAQQIQEAENNLLAAQDQFEQAQQDWQQTQASQLAELSALSPQAARKQALKQARAELQSELSQQLQDFEQELKTRSQELSQEILTRALQRTAVSHAREQMAIALPLPDMSWRGRVIGKEGRMVQALQSATGADFSLDDELPQVWVSSFDPWRRELARRTLQSLIEQNKMQPNQAETESKRIEQQLESELPRLGEAAALEAQVQNLAPELLRTLGLLHYRRSFGQDVLQHSLEVSLLAGLLAQQLGADIETARRAGLLHDLGKALADPEKPQTHTQLGLELAQRQGESPAVLHAIEAHHFDVEPQTVEAWLVQIADTLSAARPGARSNQLSKHVQRLGQCETIARRFEGVKRAWVLKAGKEVRVMVDPDQVPENRLRLLAAEIAQAISQELQLPGQVKVSVIRELQATDYVR